MDTKFKGLVGEYLTDKGVDDLNDEIMELGLKDFQSEFENALRQAKRLKAKTDMQFKVAVKNAMDAIAEEGSDDIDFEIDNLMGLSYEKDDREADLKKIAEVYKIVFGEELQD